MNTLPLIVLQVLLKHQVKALHTVQLQKKYLNQNVNKEKLQVF